MKLHKRKRQNKESWEQLQENVKLTDQQYFYVFGIYGIHTSIITLRRALKDTTVSSIFSVRKES